MFLCLQVSSFAESLKSVSLPEYRNRHAGFWRGIDGFCLRTFLYLCVSLPRPANPDQAAESASLLRGAGQPSHFKIQPIHVQKGEFYYEELHLQLLQYVRTLLGP